MLSQKLFRWMNKIALFAIVFASLAPSISHAMAANSGTSFAQEICSTNGKIIIIQVLTSQGQQLATELSVNAEKPTKNIVMHLEHCPFCANHAVAAGLPNNNLQIITLLEISAQKAAKYAIPVFASRHYKSPPSQAPPHLSVI